MSHRKPDPYLDSIVVKYTPNSSTQVVQETPSPDNMSDKVVSAELLAAERLEEIARQLRLLAERLEEVARQLRNGCSAGTVSSEIEPRVD